MTPEEEAGERPVDPPPSSLLAWQRAIAVLSALGAFVGAFAAVAQILDYAATQAATLWISVGVILTVVPALLVTTVFIVRKDWRTLSLVLPLLLLAVGGATIISWQIDGLVRPSCPDGDRESDPPRYVYPDALDNAEDADFEYCRVDVNEGRPLGRQYTLSGKVIGSVPRGRVVALVVQPDPGSCDTLGQPGNGNYYLRQTLRFDGEASSWDRSDVYFYPGAVTLRYNVYYVLTTESVLNEMRKHAATFTNSAGGYSGIPELPEPSQKLASFSYRGSGKDAKPCR